VTAGFTGIPEEALEFWTGLAADNSKAYWTAHRSEFDRYVATPTQELVDALSGEFGPLKVFRPYRDVRFSRDKQPYKLQTSLVTTESERGLLYLQLGLDGLLVAGGFYQPDTATLSSFRTAVDEPRVAASFDRITQTLAGEGLNLDGDPLRTAPRGWPKGHPRIDLLRLRNLALVRHEPLQEWMHTPRLLDEVQATWRRLQTWNEWLREHVR